MTKKDIDSILLANWYFTKCKMEDPNCHKTELARKYLIDKIGRVLSDRIKTSFNSDTTLSLS